jgi:cysteine desulfurase
VAALGGSRARIAALLSARPGEFVFVSGGTEADNHALKGTIAEAFKSGRNRIITTTVEHHAVLETCAWLGMHGCDLKYLPVEGIGMTSPDVVRRAITPKTALISVMHANNEIGTINPIRDIAAVAREAGVVFHSDAAQSFGKIPLRCGDDGPDLLTISAHKIYGPKGIGGLCVRRGVKIEKFMHGGGQERGARAGTENVPLAPGRARRGRSGRVDARRGHAAAR